MTWGLLPWSRIGRRRKCWAHPTFVLGFPENSPRTGRSWSRERYRWFPVEVEGFCVGRSVLAIPWPPPMVVPTPLPQ